MERYLSKDEGSRLYFSYEAFVDPLAGSGEAMRLANFLAAGLRHNALEWVMNSMENYVDGGDGDGDGDGSGAEEHPIDAFLMKGGGEGGGRSQPGGGHRQGSRRGHEDDGEGRGGAVRVEGGGAIDDVIGVGVGRRRR